MTRAERIDAGLCLDCGKPARPDRLKCAECGARDSEVALAYYRRRTGARARTTRCGRCSKPGHDRRLCPQERRSPISQARAQHPRERLGRAERRWLLAQIDARGMGPLARLLAFSPSTVAYAAAGARLRMATRLTLTERIRQHTPPRPEART